MKLKQDPKRVLHIVSGLERGGAETLIMNVYRNIDRTQVQFDFIVHLARKGDYEDEIIKMGGKIYKIPSLGQLGAFSYTKELAKIMRSFPYIAVHSHTDYQGGFSALAAKICGIENRICHSHSNNWPKGNGVKARFTLKILKILIKLFATSYCSCSKEAAQFLFGENMIAKSKVNILKNGIDLSQYSSIDPNSKRSVIDEFYLHGDVKIIGHVGHFSDSKNHMFILNVLKKLLEKDNRFVALLVGEGPLKSQIEMEGIRLGISEYVRFLGVRTDIPRLMKSFDVFLFPSIFEGFGIVVLEAQSAGTPCVVSDSVPKTTDMGLNLVSYVGLDKKIEIWIEEIHKALNLDKLEDKKIYNKMLTSGFNIKENVPNWLSLYGC
ncbi:MAG: glycosyltransferase [Bacillus sp. (in: Bacteria)]|nr:glycosyltransferase [Bacillus sp. (in: firmicutes)]